MKLAVTLSLLASTNFIFAMTSGHGRKPRKPSSARYCPRAPYIKSPPKKEDCSKTTEALRACLMDNQENPELCKKSFKLANKCQEKQKSSSQ